jgi:hypothetical protein
MSHDIYNFKELYRDLYFHELDVREKITNRLQITFAFHATILGIIAYMMRTVDYQSDCTLLSVFYTSICLSLLFLSLSAYQNIRAFWGNTYKGLASPDLVETFRQNAEKHEKEICEYKSQYPEASNVEDYNANEKTNDYLFNEFAQCTTHNTEVNDQRSSRVHYAIKWLLIALIPMLVSSFIFIIYDLDTSSPRKKIVIEYDELTKAIDDLGSNISEPLRLELNNTIKEIVNMTHRDNDDVFQSDDIPPPPPAPEPPEPRDIIESEDPPITADN